MNMPVLVSTSAEDIAKQFPDNPQLATEIIKLFTVFTQVKPYYYMNLTSLLIDIAMELDFIKPSATFRITPTPTESRAYHDQKIEFVEIFIGGVATGIMIREENNVLTISNYADWSIE